MKKHLFKGSTSSGSGSFEPGSEVVVDNYHVTIESLIAEGGFGSVYLVTDGAKKYALKKVMVHDQETLDATTREIEFMKQLPFHHNIVTIHASDLKPAGKHAEVVILMEHCPGGHVVDIMNRRLTRPFTEREVLKIFSDICLAVTALHQQRPPIIHRDLKLENVLLSEDKGSFKLCDFGSATVKVLHPGAQDPIPVCEEEIQKYTTPNYRAPEMVDLYQSHAINEKADIWALGCVLYKLCFFTDAFGDSSLSIVSGKYKIPDHHDFSPAVIDLLAATFELDPTKRIGAEALCKVTKLGHASDSKVLASLLLLKRGVSHRVFALRQMPCPLLPSSITTLSTPAAAAPPLTAATASVLLGAGHKKTHQRSPSNPFDIPPNPSNPFARASTPNVKLKSPFASNQDLSADWAFGGDSAASSLTTSTASATPSNPAKDSGRHTTWENNPFA
ncbi:uncharacterized protein MONBRDRAFT_22473 [Monosiga brevicollis MX1]|uniref:non-specific serine/threonine protein kinase n=1 Tax=Monosiga brevicollis TaxID=81824 RepID=A9UQP2_MONBE|nr:uncharacterized protein MONBRDRAFT_22473 [Monosiga brevicollis MX1]EDQ93079.1 predicted protein [Monosiga brevicollis MX1]|eukprot:XP_001742841.1 hypothetical protein [Monosiga brevicollis MX1]